MKNTKDCIDFDIDQNERFIRFIFANNLKHKNKLTIDSIKDNLLFYDSRFPCISINRNRYSDEKFSFITGSQNSNKLVGFALFNYDEVAECKVTQQLSDPLFDAEIKATPLNEDNQIYQQNVPLVTSSKGNLAHADLVYSKINSQIREEISISTKLFSRLLFKKSNFYFINIDGTFPPPYFD